MKRLLLWDFARASWQYDLMVAAILAFIFLTPREFFRDQPRASNVVMLPSSGGDQAFWIEPHQLPPNEPERTERARQMLRNQKGRRHELVRLEPVLDAEQELKGYMAFTKP